MSTRKGESTRKRPQKYQNTKAYKNDLHDKTPQIKRLNNLQISNVCERCKNILEWKIKYKKFKALKAPGTCTKCSEKCVKHAYHIMCKPCADKIGVCPKCGKKEELVEPVPTPEEILKSDQEMQAMLKSLPERKRRTFLRYVEKQRGESKKKDKRDEVEDDEKDKVKKKTHNYVPEHVTEDDEEKKGTHDLMAFLERLKLSCKSKDEDGNFEDFDDFGDTDSDESFESDDDDNDDEDDGDGDNQ